ARGVDDPHDVRRQVFQVEGDRTAAVVTVAVAGRLAVAVAGWLAVAVAVAVAGRLAVAVTLAGRLAVAVTRGIAVTVARGIAVTGRTAGVVVGVLGAVVGVSAEGGRTRSATAADRCGRQQSESRDPMNVQHRLELTTIATGARPLDRQSAIGVRPVASRERSRAVATRGPRRRGSPRDRCRARDTCPRS